MCCTRVETRSNPLAVSQEPGAATATEGQSTGSSNMTQLINLFSKQLFYNKAYVRLSLMDEVCVF
jgi:hypothetical protein